MCTCDLAMTFALTLGSLFTLSGYYKTVGDELHHHRRGWHLGHGQIVSDGDVGGSQIKGVHMRKDMKKEYCF